MYHHPITKALPWVTASLSLLLLSPQAHAGRGEAQKAFDACYLEAQTAYEKGAYAEVNDRLDDPDCANYRKIEAVEQRYLLLLRTDIALSDSISAKKHAIELLRNGYDEAPDAVREPEMAAALAEALSELAATQTSSVSRVAEDIRLVPATIYIITAQQIRDRGYVDIEAILHDVPGIDFSRGGGVSYSNLYMRGLRSDNSDRVLFLIDGIEQNELHTNVAYISRQFSLSDVERVEVVYGPASTLYGANAYAGVINVVTRDGSDLLDHNGIFGMRVDAGFGGGARQMSTRVIDGQMVLSDRKRRVIFSVAGRWYLGHDQDLSSFSNWDYQTTKYDEDHQDHVYDTTDGDADLRGEWREEDDHNYRNAGYSYRDISHDWSLKSKLKLGRRFEIGVSGWSRLEGQSGWLRETASPSVSGTWRDRDGALWHPRMWAAHIRYSDRITPTLSLTVFSRYTTHDLGRKTQWYSENSIASKRPGMPTSDSPTVGTARHRNSTMWRNEIFVNYRPKSWISVVGGGDFRYGKVQGNYPPDPGQKQERESEIGDQRLLWAVGAFATLSVKPITQFSLSAGLRYDYGKSDGFVIYGGPGVVKRGVVSPRAAIVFASKNERWFVKFFYSKAFFNPTNWQRYTSSSTRDPNPELEVETANNIEASVQYVIAGGPLVDHGVLVGSSVYGTIYRNVHQLRGATFEENRTRVVGNQTTLRYSYKRALDISASYSYTYAQTRAEDESDPWASATHIAPHKANVGVAVQPFKFVKGPAALRLKRSNIVISLRTNIVGNRNGFCERLLSQGQLDENEEGKPWEALSEDEIARCRPYATLNGALTYSRNTNYGTWWVQLSGLNLLNYQYSDPGVRETAIYVAAHPQPGISAFGRVGFEF